MYTLEKVEFLNLDKLESFFANLPSDIYLPDNYRFRRFSYLKILSSQLTQLPHKSLLQNKQYNSLFGDIPRHFQQLEDDLIKLDDFKNLVFKFISCCHIAPENTELEAHQIRITCSETTLGKPAPEGIHQDGHNFVGIFCVRRENILGGETQLYLSKKESPVFTKTLEPGELLVVNDEQLFHFTTPITPVFSGKGLRDVLIFAFRQQSKK